MASDDAMLEAAAHDGSMDYSKWPDLLKVLLPRLDHIVYNDFPIPTVPLLKTPNSPLGPTSPGGEAPQSPKIDRSPEHAERKTAPLPSSSPARSPSASAPAFQTVIPDSQPSEVSASSRTLPPQLLSFYSNIQISLRASFSNAPPFTVQRLTELILRPNAHYRTLPSYLRALDRVISVSSTAGTFPLPLIPTGEIDGNSYLASSGALGHSEDFNGATLTRIPWLRDTASLSMGSDRPLTTDLRTESTSVIDGPNGAGSIETVTVSVNGFSSPSRGDLASRQEPLPMGESDAADALPEPLLADSGPAHRQEDEADEERVHARGPDEIGMEDMGPQQGGRRGHIFDAEAALGRPGEAERFPSLGTRAVSESRDGDADTVVPDKDASNGEGAETFKVIQGEGENVEDTRAVLL